MLQLGHERGHSQAAHLVSKATSTLGNLECTCCRRQSIRRYTPDSHFIRGTHQFFFPKSCTPLEEEKIWKESYNFFTSLPDSVQTEETFDHMMSKVYNDHNDALLCHYSFESDFYQLLNNALPTDKSLFNSSVFPVTTIDTGASTEMCARKQTFVPVVFLVHTQI